MSPPEPITFVVAAFNEEAALPLLQARLSKVMDGLDRPARVLYVDDGSHDGTWTLVERFAAADPRVRGLRLSRNFGKEAALTAGLDHVAEGAALVLDADGQDPPELASDFIAQWQAGHDVVYGRRLHRDGETWLKKVTAAAFYRLINRLSDIPIPSDTGDFRLLSPRALMALRGLRERQRFMKGLFAWLGYPSIALDYHREARSTGRSKFNYWRLWNFALEGITGFSTVPLRVATYIGLLSAMFAFAYGLYVVVKTLLWGDPVAGWPSMMALIAFLGGLQLMALGILGEYLGRLYLESKQRPLYLLRERVGPT